MKADTSDATSERALPAFLPGMEQWGVDPAASRLICEYARLAIRHATRAPVAPAAVGDLNVRDAERT